MDKSERPILNLPFSPLETILDRLGLAGVLLGIAVLTATWPDLPQRVPTHFGASGAPNAWGGKTSLLIGPIVALVIYIGLTLLARYPHLYNYPKRLSADNAERMYRLGRGLIIWLKTEIVWLFTWLSWATINVALGHAAGLGPWPIYVALGIIYGTTTWYAIALFRTK